MAKSMEEGMTFSRLADKLHFLEATLSLEQVKEKARKVRVSPSGTKREILERILVKIAEDTNEKIKGEGRTRMPMTSKKRAHKRTAFYVQFWSPKSDPASSQPYHWNGPEEAGAFKSLDDALRGASLLEDKRPNAFGIDIYSREEIYEPDPEYPDYGYWQAVEGTMISYDRRGAITYKD